jgi:hypothetical protein
MEEVVIIEENKLNNVYIEKGNNIFDTAAELRVSVQTVMASLKKYDMGFVKPKHLYSDLRKTDFSEFQRDMVIGSILGDGCVYKKSNSRNCVFEIRQSVKQREWAFWKANNLKPFFGGKAIMTVKGKQNHRFEDIYGVRYVNTNDDIRITINSHPYFTEIRNVFYPKGKKIIPVDYLEGKFNMNSLAVLIGDDGCLLNKGYGLKICTLGFEKKHVYEFAEFLSTLFDGTISVYKAKHYISGIKYYIYMGGLAHRKPFVSELRNILPKCMHYKLPTVLNEHQTVTQLNE